MCARKLRLLNNQLVGNSKKILNVYLTIIVKGKIIVKIKVKLNLL